METYNQVKLDLNSSSEVLEMNYKWNIPKYHSSQIYSEKLKLKDDIECTIMLIPKIVNKMHVNLYDKKKFARHYFTLFFTKVPDDDNNTILSFDVREHDRRRPVAFGRCKKLEMTINGFTAYKNNLNSFNYKYYVGKDGALNLDVKFIVDDFSCKSFNLDNFDKNRSQLSRDYAKIYDDPKFNDLMISCANNDDEIVLANKAVLASRSPIFAEMLNCEASPYVIQIDSSKEVIVEFLRFLYTDSISINEFNANTVELWKLAKKYQVKDLAYLCEQNLMFEFKNQLVEIFDKFKDLSDQNISELKNFVDISRCVKDLYKAIKNINK